MFLPNYDKKKMRRGSFLLAARFIPLTAIRTRCVRPPGGRRACAGAAMAQSVLRTSGYSFKIYLRIRSGGSAKSLRTLPPPCGEVEGDHRSASVGVDGATNTEQNCESVTPTRTLLCSVRPPHIVLEARLRHDEEVCLLLHQSLYRLIQAIRYLNSRLWCFLAFDKPSCAGQAGAFLGQDGLE